MGKKRFKSKCITLGHTDNPVGYCVYHKSTMSKTQMDSKQCLEKECGYFKKNTKHAYWTQLDKKKAEAKIKRAERKIREREYYMNLDKQGLIRAIKYCKECPPDKKGALEYCSQCPYGTKCMAGIMDDVYEYFTKYEK